MEPTNYAISVVMDSLNESHMEVYCLKCSIKTLEEPRDIAGIVWSGKHTSLRTFIGATEHHTNEVHTPVKEN